MPVTSRTVTHRGVSTQAARSRPLQGTGRGFSGRIVTAVERLDLNDFTSITRHAVLLVLLQKQGEYKTSGFLIYNNRTLQLQPATASSYTKLQSIRQTPEEEKKLKPETPYYAAGTHHTHTAVVHKTMSDAGPHRPYMTARACRYAIRAQ